MEGNRWILPEELERKVLGDISEQQLWQHCEALTQWEKEDGTDGEQSTARYVEEMLLKEGIDTETHSIDALISLPAQASLEVVSPEVFDIECITHSFAASTKPEGLEGELSYAAAGDDGSHEQADLAQRIALIEGLANPEKAKLAEERGAAAAILIGDEFLHEMTISTVWGSPSSRTVGHLPSIPCISIKRTQGDRLKQLTAAGLVRVRLKCQTRTGWEKLPLVVGTVVGSEEPRRFVLVGTHLDAWYVGATDNCAGIAASLELARVFAKHKEDLRRSVRFVFWPGHSQGRYSGSTWYADHFWGEINRACVTHVNIDCPGMKGATVYTELYAMAEIAAFAKQVIKDVTGQDATRLRMPRSGDQSLWSVGVPSLFIALSLLPVEDNPDVIGILGQAPGARQPKGGAGWWWHTRYDTIDKIDPGVLTTDARVFALSVLRLSCLPILPFDYMEVAKELYNVLKDLDSKVGELFEFGGLLDLTARLREHCETLNTMIGTLLEKSTEDSVDKERLDILNGCLIRLGRLLIPTNYTVEGPYDQDLAIPIPPVPGLHPTLHLADMSPGSDEFKLLSVDLVRQRNRVLHSLAQGIDCIADAIGHIG